MKPVPINEAFRSQEMSPFPSRLMAMLSVGLLVAGPLACGPMEPDTEPSSEPALEESSQELSSDNGLMANGLSANGLSANGLSANGLSANGLSANGLSSSSFNTWFAQNPTLNDTVMRYIVRCAVPAGQVRTYRSPQTRVTYRWAGGLGLAPSWANGRAATLAEQQLVSACMAAHVNKFGVSVTISLLGKTATGQIIPFTFDELHQYSRREACFFGNLFNGQGVFFGSDGPRLRANESSSRACELSSSDPYTNRACPPLSYAGTCEQLCQPIVPGGFYLTCTWNGVTYKALTSRVRPSEIYTCGDRICQISEQCGNGQGSGCQQDCGRCSGG
ncbi:hypothetical protein [Hyalangium gracile]|uniref:hypothetical protein n=1 Tax=Hyalangium gracile TaxID=394092 RepID=UPI001CCE4FBF|nr:hypothetical protein [Hyalangium gracile]